MRRVVAWRRRREGPRRGKRGPWVVQRHALVRVRVQETGNAGQRYCGALTGVQSWGTVGGGWGGHRGHRGDDRVRGGRGRAGLRWLAAPRVSYIMSLPYCGTSRDARERLHWVTRLSTWGRALGGHAARLRGLLRSAASAKERRPGWDEGGRAGGRAGNRGQAADCTPKHGGSICTR